jgi:glutathione synthase/RimK-type ligase-like ATP-grasp enzyme
VDIALVTGGEAPVGTVDAPLVRALEGLGAVVHTPRWDDADVDWSRFAVAVVRTTWDYPTRRDAFVAWAAATAERTSLWNPADVLRWNTHKSYLLELEERGAPVVPTAWLAEGDRIHLGDLLASRDWSRAVVKPAVANGGAGSLRTHTVAPADAQAHLDALLARGDVLVQPYLEAVESTGEVGVIAIDGEVTHAVRKRPAAGEFLVQERAGGTRERLDLGGESREAVALAGWVLEASGHELLYARVDLLPDDAGVWQLAELELVEPDLSLQLAPEVGERLARAIVARA